MKLLLCYRLPIFILCTLIFIQSEFPSQNLGIDFPLKDKLLHFLVYGVLAILFFRNFQVSHGKKRGIARMMILSIVCSTLYGLSDEIHQAFVVYRHADGFDLLADFAGSLFGVVGYVLFSVKKKVFSAQTILD